ADILPVVEGSLRQGILDPAPDQIGHDRRSAEDRASYLPAVLHRAGLADHCKLACPQQIVDVTTRPERAHVDLATLERLPKLGGAGVAAYPSHVPPQKCRTPEDLIVSAPQRGADQAHGDRLRRFVVEPLEGVLADEQ